MPLYPDAWIVLKFKEGKNVWYKLLSSWAGGYMSGDSWRMSSEILRVIENTDTYEVHTRSGSHYVIAKDAEGMRLATRQIYEQLKTQALSGVKLNIKQCSMGEVSK